MSGAATKVSEQNLTSLLIPDTDYCTDADNHMHNNHEKKKKHKLTWTKLCQLKQYNTQKLNLEQQSVMLKNYRVLKYTETVTLFSNWTEHEHLSASSKRINR